MPSEFPMEGIVYILHNDLHPKLSKIGYSRHSDGALDRLDNYSEDHGFEGWVVYSSLFCVMPALVERRVHEKLRKDGLQWKTLTGSRELFRITADEAAKLIEWEAGAQCALAEAAAAKFRESEKVRRQIKNASPNEAAEELADARRASLYKHWKRTGKW